MKDWKTYAVVALAAWCAYLSFRTDREQPPTSASHASADFTDNPPVVDADGFAAAWAYGGVWLTLDCYCKLSPQVDGSLYTALQRCRLSFDGSGRLVRAEILPERSRLKADCRTNDAKKAIRRSSPES